VPIVAAPVAATGRAGRSSPPVQASPFKAMVGTRAGWLVLSDRLGAVFDDGDEGEVASIDLSFGWPLAHIASSLRVKIPGFSDRMTHPSCRDAAIFIPRLFSVGLLSPGDDPSPKAPSLLEQTIGRSNQVGASAV
jgi:hypothetical protein